MLQRSTHNRDYSTEVHLEKHHRDEILKLGIGRALSSFHDMLEGASRGGERKLALVAGHDTTIIPLMLALDVHTNTWPAFAACFCIELLKHREEEGN